MALFDFGQQLCVIVRNRFAHPVFLLIPVTEAVRRGSWIESQFTNIAPAFDLRDHPYSAVVKTILYPAKRMLPSSC
jgi:hypothetical protein